jgi:hypothetical protein
MKREPHVRFCEGLGCNSLGLLTYGHADLGKRTFRICALGAAQAGCTGHTPVANERAANRAAETPDQCPAVASLIFASA